MTEHRVGTVGHVDHGKTTLTAAITLMAPRMTGRDLREGAGDVALSVMNPEGQQRIREAAQAKGLNPDRIYFIGEAIVVDGDGDDAEYNRAAREEVILGRHRVSSVEHAQPLKRQWEESLARYDAAFITESFPSQPKGKQGKNKSTRRFPLPSRRPLK